MRYPPVHDIDAGEITKLTRRQEYGTSIQEYLRRKTYGWFAATGADKKQLYRCYMHGRQVRPGWRHPRHQAEFRPKLIHYPGSPGPIASASFRREVICSYVRYPRGNTSIFERNYWHHLGIRLATMALYQYNRSFSSSMIHHCSKSMFRRE